MYDELVKRLRNRRICIQQLGTLNDYPLLGEAADAIEELSKPRWIPVTERLPNSGVCVLITDGLEVGEGCLTEITNTRGYFMRWCAPTADIDVDRRPITHWMPLPEPPKQQANNRRSNRKIAYNGEERNIAEWADYFGIESSKFNAAIQRGRTIDEILERERKNGNLSA